MADDSRDAPTRDARFPGKTVTIQPARSYAVPGGPKAKNLGETTTKVLSEMVRGDGDDLGAGRS